MIYTCICVCVGEQKKMSTQKSNSNTVGLNFKKYKIFNINLVFQVTLKSSGGGNGVLLLRRLYLYFISWDGMMNSLSSYTIYMY
jgi:hypothetical protein